MIADLQRAQGKLKVGLQRQQDGGTRLIDLFQEGCLKARLPRPQSAGEVDLVMINTAGGLTGGDCVSIEITLSESARATITTPACERIYRSSEGEASIQQYLRVARGARLDWIPQETILYDRSRVRRRLEVQLEDDAEITVADAILLGRVAMGEIVTDGSYADLRIVRRDARLLFVDATRIVEAFRQARDCPALLGRHVALATLIHVGPNSAAKRDALRARFADNVATQAGASVVGEVLVARIVAAGGSALRPVLIAALAILRDARPLPRLWSC
jgi:urease accessory protein